MITDHILDNFAWHALNTHHANFAIGEGLAKRYPPAIAPFVGLAENTDAALHDLAEISKTGDFVVLEASNLPSQIPGWTTRISFEVIQMVCDQNLPEAEGGAIQVSILTDADVPEMMNLVKLTDPGPFFPRTIEMGRYIGIRQEGQLIAMAGERVYLPNYREISAVCTHPDHQRKGYARFLVTRLVNLNWENGDVPFLHVFNQNTRAINLYETLHFQKRRQLQFRVVSRD